jgi:hypothetical protein
MNFLGASLAKCSDLYSCSEANLSYPFGDRNFECDADNDCLFRGGWHTRPSGAEAFVSITKSIQVRFLDSTGDHLTNVYVGCSYAVYIPNFGLTHALGCTPLRS